MADIVPILLANLQAVRERIAKAAEQAGRPVDSIRLVAVTKYVSADVARALVEAGVYDLAESRPQAFWEKAAQLADLPIRWHFVGHLQRNKIQRTIPHVHLLHSADRVSLLEDLQKTCEQQHRRLAVLLEVNTSGDAAKHGFTPEELPQIVDSLSSFSQLEILGLMTMAALEGGDEVALANFQTLRQLRDQSAQSSPERSNWELSMGMSDDFPLAIQAGATLVRVGSALFEGLSDADLSP